MKLFICTVILLSTLPLMAQNSTDQKKEPSAEEKQFTQVMKQLMREPSESERESMQLYGQWTQELIEFLLNHEQPYAQAIGLNQSNSILQAQSAQADPDAIQIFYQSLGQHINKLVNDETLNIETLQILEALCFQKELNEYCNRQALLDKQMQLYPSELSVYLRPLQLALDTDNQDLTAKLMQVMSGTQQFSMVDYLLPEFIDLVQEYIKDKPFPEGALLRQKNNELLTRELTEQQIELLEQRYSDYMPYSILQSMRLALPIPAFSPLKTICQTEPEFSAECLYMANIMLNESNATLSKAMGHIINLAVYELNNQQDMLAASQANQLRLKKYNECLGQAIHANQIFDDLFDQNYTELWMTAEDELKRLTKMATYLYEKRHGEGAENIINPESCSVQ